MADPELVKTLDYILNRCDEASIEAVAAAVVRRKRELAMFGNAKLPDPRAWAKQVASGAGAGAGLANIKNMVKDMAAGMLRREAPELSEEQVEELLGAWVDGKGGAGGSRPEGLVDHDGRGDDGPDLAEGPADAGADRGGRTALIKAMADQFVAYSLERMGKDEDAALRSELGDWPDRYWKAFPPAVRETIRDFLKGGMTEGEYLARLRAALDLST